MKFYLGTTDITNKAFCDANGTGHPSTFCTSTTKLEREAAGVTDVAEVFPTYNTATHKLDGTYVDTPTDIFSVTRTYNVIPIPAVESNAPILTQLSLLDGKRSRPLSDIALGNGAVIGADGKTPIQRLQDIETLRVALTSQLK